MQNLSAALAERQRQLDIFRSTSNNPAYFNVANDARNKLRDLDAYLVSQGVVFDNMGNVVQVPQHQQQMMYNQPYQQQQYMQQPNYVNQQQYSGGMYNRGAIYSNNNNYLTNNSIYGNNQDNSTKAETNNGSRFGRRYQQVPQKQTSVQQEVKTSEEPTPVKKEPIRGNKFPIFTSDGLVCNIRDIGADMYEYVVKGSYSPGETTEIFEDSTTNPIYIKGDKAKEYTLDSLYEESEKAKKVIITNLYLSKSFVISYLKRDGLDLEMLKTYSKDLNKDNVITKHPINYDDLTLYMVNLYNYFINEDLNMRIDEGNVKIDSILLDLKALYIEASKQVENRKLGDDITKAADNVIKFAKGSEFIIDENSEDLEDENDPVGTKSVEHIIKIPSIYLNVLSGRYIEDNINITVRYTNDCGALRVTEYGSKLLFNILKEGFDNLDEAKDLNMIALIDRNFKGHYRCRLVHKVNDELFIISTKLHFL